MLTLHVFFFEGGGKCALHNETLDTYKLQSDLQVTGNRLSEIYILHSFWISLKLGNGVSSTAVSCLWNTVIKTIRVCHRAVVGINMTPGDLLGRVTSIREHYVTTHTLISNGLLKCLLVSSRHADHSYPNHLPVQRGYRPSRGVQSFPTVQGQRQCPRQQGYLIIGLTSVSR